MLPDRQETGGAAHHRPGPEPGVRPADEPDEGRSGPELFHQPGENHRAMQKEKEVGYTVFKDVSLEELEQKFISDKEWEDAQMSLEDFIPCECWT